MLQWIYDVLQAPLQGLSDSPRWCIDLSFHGRVLLVLWVHGGLIMGVVSVVPSYYQIRLDNAALLAKGELTPAKMVLTS